jgi:uncharacterized protein YdeI (YjbR/CyaY-like superfamily)
LYLLVLLYAAKWGGVCRAQHTKGILITQTENVQAARQIWFTNVREVAEMEAILKAYIGEAIEHGRDLLVPPTSGQRQPNG